MRDDCFRNSAVRRSSVARRAFCGKFANSVKSGCVSPELKAAGTIDGLTRAGVNLPRYSRTGIRKSKTGRWRAAALILLNLLMIGHIIQWRLMSRTISPIEPSETMYTLQNGFVNAGFIFFSLAILATLIFGRFVCGWGCHILALQGFCGLADKFSLGKIRVTPACNQCGHCTATCTSNVLVHAEVKQYGMVVDPGCMKCMDCVSVCPNDALYFGFGKPALLAPKSNVIKRHYSLTWPEEIVGALLFLGSFLAVRGVYALVPFLMALGCAAVTTFLTLKTWRLLRARELSFYRFNF